MVTVRNDIEMIAAAPDGTKIKDVNIKQEARPIRRRSYRCITIVGVVALLLVSLGVGSVLLFDDVLKGTTPENSADVSPSSTTEPEEASVHHQSVPEFADPFDGRTGQAEIALDPVDDDVIDIDETQSTTTTAATPAEVDSLDEGRSGDGHDDDDSEELYSAGSGSGDDDMW